MTFTAIDVSKLAPPTLVPDVTFEDVLERFRAYVLANDPEMIDVIDLESDPTLKQMQLLAYESQLQRNGQNLGVISNYLAFAAGPDLDHLAVIWSLARLSGESDDRFRRRIQLAPEGLSVFGSLGSYEFHALSVDAQIVGVSVASPAPVEVVLSLLLEEGLEVARIAEIKAAVEDRFAVRIQEADVRPFTDQVTIELASAISFDVTANLTIGSGPDPDVVLEQARASLRAYLAERRALGRIVSATGVGGALHVAGVETVNLVAPLSDITPAAYQFGAVATVSVARVGHE